MTDLQKSSGDKTSPCGNIICPNSNKLCYVCELFQFCSKNCEIDKYSQMRHLPYCYKIAERHFPERTKVLREKVREKDLEIRCFVCTKRMRNSVTCKKCNLFKFHAEGKCSKKAQQAHEIFCLKYRNMHPIGTSNVQNKPESKTTDEEAERKRKAGQKLITFLYSIPKLKIDRKRHFTNSRKPFQQVLINILDKHEADYTTILQPSKRYSQSTRTFLKEQTEKVILIDYV